MVTKDNLLDDLMDIIAKNIGDEKILNNITQAYLFAKKT